MERGRRTAGDDFGNHEMARNNAVLLSATPADFQFRSINAETRQDLIEAHVDRFLLCDEGVLGAEDRHQPRVESINWSTRRTRD